MQHSVYKVVQDLVVYLRLWLLFRCFRHTLYASSSGAKTKSLLLLLSLLVIFIHYIYDFYYYYCTHAAPRTRVHSNSRIAVVSHIVSGGSGVRRVESERDIVLL